MWGVGHREERLCRLARARMKLLMVEKSPSLAGNRKVDASVRHERVI